MNKGAILARSTISRVLLPETLVAPLRQQFASTLLQFLTRSLFLGERAELAFNGNGFYAASFIGESAQ
jgi:hypothetical protein